jgi:hypothetical protein
MEASFASEMLENRNRLRKQRRLRLLGKVYITIRNDERLRVGAVFLI